MLNALTNVRFWGQSGHGPTAAYQSRFMSTRPRSEGGHRFDLSPEKTVGDLIDAELMAIVRGSKYLEPDPKGEQVA